MRGLTEEEAEALRNELTRTGEPAVTISDAEIVIYDRLTARGLLRVEETWEPCENDPGMEAPFDIWFTTEMGRRVLAWHEMLRVQVVA